MKLFQLHNSKIKKRFLFTGILIFVLFFSYSYTNASTTNGIIDPNNVGRYKAKVLNNGGLGAGQINFGKFTTQSSKNISITDAGLRGFAFGEVAGWIVVNCEDTTSGCTVSNNNFKVSVSNTGILSGYAWGEVAGWINFGPFVGGSGASQVKIDSNGLFGGTLGTAGYAWSQNFGWIIFDCTDVDSCVETDYVPIDFRITSSSGSRRSGVTVPSVIFYECNDGIDNDNDGKIDFPEDSGCENPNDNSEYFFIKTPNDPLPNNPPTNDLPPAPPNDPLPSNPPIKNNNSFGGTTKSIEEFTGGKVIDKIFETIPEIKNIAISWPRLSVLVGIIGLLAYLINNKDRLLQWLSWMFGLFGKRRKWGTVYDSITKYPLDPAYVLIKDIYGKTVGESITDLDGRYGFLVPPGSYFITAQKTNYTFPSEKLKNLPFDEVYTDLYFGGKIEITDQEQVISKNIPMDPVGVDWNEIEKRRTKIGTYSRKVLFRKIAGIFFYLGFVIAVVSFLLTMSWLHFGILCAYLLLFASNAVSSTRGAIVKSKITGKPVSYAIVKIYSATDNREAMKKVTSPEGKFFALVTSGLYRLTVETKNSDGTYSLAHTSDVFKVNKGFISKKVFI